jgi:chemotaxis protein MotB
VSAGEEETKAQEILIIRRPIGGEDAPHKGGVWKIAYADFMTAMMAFFLVMWLINASDKQTLTQVATYFNPLRLTDKVALSKGMHEEDPVTQSSGNPEQAVEPTKDSRENGPATSKQQAGKAASHARADGAKPRYTEEVLFRDPYGVLSKLAKEASEDHPRPARGGEGYRDPFDPAFRRVNRAEKRDVARETATPAAVQPPGGQNTGEARSAPPAAAEEPHPPGMKQAAEPQPLPPPTKPAAEARPQQAPEPQKASEPQKVSEAQKSSEPMRKAAEEATERAKAAKLEADIRAVVARAIAGALPNITVTVTDEGLLISLTDDQNFGMFAIASAEPRPPMVVLMEKLGRVIADFPEPLVVRGHTDGRPYKSGTYDNWRLSTARAHMAYYMLVRAGITEKRFERIEGHADRSLKIPNDPDAAQNRRIEILLRKARS